MLKKQLLKNANVKILVANYQPNEEKMKAYLEDGWESSGASQHIEQTTVGTIPKISIAKTENDMMGFDSGGRGSYKGSAAIVYKKVNGIVFILPKLTARNQEIDAKVTFYHISKYSNEFWHKPLLILMENNPSDSELERSDKRTSICEIFGNWMLTKVEYVDSLENKEEIEKNLVWLQEQVMNQILNPPVSYYEEVSIKTGDSRNKQKKAKSLEQTIAKEEKKQNGMFGFLFK